jgi:aminoglycoside phosphotransferase (APT) family kinase protein
VQSAHRYDVDRLDAYLRANLEGYGAALRVRQVAGGASNLTFVLETEGGAVRGATSCARSRRASCWPALIR